MATNIPIGIKKALRLLFSSINSLSSETVLLQDAVDRIAAEDIRAVVDSPSVHASLKDGYAVISDDIAQAGKTRPVSLLCKGLLTAGSSKDIRVTGGTAVQILTGSRIPTGADAVVADEFVRQQGDKIFVHIHAETGRNILNKGTDVRCGEVIVEHGRYLTPGIIGLLAAAGHHQVKVIRNPAVSIIATGDEIIAPGQPLPEGKLYASNISTLFAWCRRYRFHPRLRLVKDETESLLTTLAAEIADNDAVITSGGAWTSDRDLVAATLTRLGWQQLFHRIRIGPGKAVGFGILNDKPVFILPGGPPSNLIGFLEIALPGLLALAGHKERKLPSVTVELAATVNGRNVDWTQFIFGTLKKNNDKVEFHPVNNNSRLASMAEAEAIIAIDEGQTVITARTRISAQILR